MGACPQFFSHNDVAEVNQSSRSFFAAIYSIAHTGQLLRSGHSLARKVALAMETLYTIINLTFAWFAIVSLQSPYVF